jgi:hypothetical protein
MADPIQTLQYQMSPRRGVIYRYQTDVNKRTGASITYDISNIGQKTPMFTSEPVIVNGKQQYETRVLSSYGPIYQNLSPELKDFIANQVVPQSSNQRAAFINKNYTQTQKNNLFAGMPKVQNTAPPDPNAGPGGTAPKPTAGSGGGGGGGTDPTSVAATDVTIAGKTKQEPGSYGNWTYPEGLGDNRQDFIEFMMVEYGRKKLGGFDIKSGLATRNINLEKILGRVLLPIQPTISDMNSVDWQNDNINPLQVLLGQASLNLQNSTFSEPELDALKGMAKSEDVKRYIQLWAAGKAAGTNLLSRFSGAVVNPNMELLFNGPQLRPFNFSFRLSPRNEREAQQVKGIIRFFKKGMAIRKTDQELFLKAPNVFKIVYRNGNNENKEHTSINKIKICALTQCSVDYTPDGSYSVFYDKESTMTQYGLTLQFNELEPIFNEDYDEAAKTTIGY